MRLEHKPGEIDLYIDDIKKTMDKDKDQIVRVQISNARSAMMRLWLEPQGSADEFPSGANYEIVAYGPRDKPFLTLTIKEDRIVVDCERAWGAIFDDKGAATDAR